MMVQRAWVENVLKYDFNAFLSAFQVGLLAGTYFDTTVIALRAHPEGLSDDAAGTFLGWVWASGAVWLAVWLDTAIIQEQDLWELLTIDAHIAAYNTKFVSKISRQSIPGFWWVHGDITNTAILEAVMTGDYAPKQTLPEEDSASSPSSQPSVRPLGKLSARIEALTRSLDALPNEVLRGLHGSIVGYMGCYIDVPAMLATQGGTSLFTPPKS